MLLTVHSHDLRNSEVAQIAVDNLDDALHIVEKQTHPGKLRSYLSSSKSTRERDIGAV
jgi:hypothetical protein